MIIQGNASVANGSSTVLFTGPTLSPLIVLVNSFVIINGETYFLSSLTNTTTFELNRPYEGTTEADASCEINSLTTEQTQIVTLNKKTADLLEQFSLLDANTQGLFFYKIAASGAVDPGPGKLSFDTDTVTARTKLYIDDLDANYPNRLVKALIATWTIGTILIFRSLSSTAYAAYKLTTNPSDLTGFQSVDISFVSSDGIIGNQEAISVAWFAIGQGLQIDAAGTFSNRSIYDDSPAGFTFLSVNGNGTTSLGAGIYRKNTADTGDWSALASLQGNPGTNGWSPRFAVASDGSRRVLQLIEYIGGTGTAPTNGVGQYLTAAGFTSTISLAVDIRGTQGVQGNAGTNGTNGTNGTDGIDGQSAFALAVAHGYVGSETSWLASLVGPKGIDGSDPGVFFIWDTGTTDANPGAAKVRGNSSNLNLATFLYMSKTNRNGDAIDGFLTSLGLSDSTRKGTLIISKPASTLQVSYDITGVTDAVNYVKISVINGAGASNFSLNDPISVQFSAAGDRGTNGDGAGDLVGPSSSTTDEIALFDGVTGKLLKTSGVLISNVVKADQNGLDFEDRKETLDNLTLKGTNITSSSTINLDIASGHLLDITGTTQTTAITLTEGRVRWLRAIDAWGIADNSVIVLLNGGDDYTASPGDMFMVFGYATHVRVLIFPVAGNDVDGMGIVTTSGVGNGTVGPYTLTTSVGNNSGIWASVSGAAQYDFSAVGDQIVFGQVVPSGIPWQVKVAGILPIGTAGAVTAGAINATAIDGSDATAIRTKIGAAQDAVLVGDSGSGGVKGLVPAPASGDAAAGKVLGASGGWVTVAQDVAFGGDSGSGGVKGLVPAPASGDAAAGKVLGAGGGWVTPATVPRGHIFGLGSDLNATDAVNDIDFAAGEAASTNTQPTLLILPLSMTKRFDAAWVAGTGNGGRFTSGSGDGWYYSYIIGNPTTGVIDIGFSDSPTDPTGGANYPSGFTLYRYIGAELRATSAFKARTRIGARTTWSVSADDGATIACVAVKTLATVTVPPNALALVRCRLSNGTTAVTLVLADASASLSLNAAEASLSAVGSGNTAGEFQLQTNGSSQIAHRASSATGSPNFSLRTYGWIDNALSPAGAPLASAELRKVACAFRYNGSALELINDTNHEPIGIISIARVAVSGGFAARLTYGFTAIKVGALIATADETFAGTYHVGGSVGLTFADIYIRNSSGTLIDPNTVGTSGNFWVLGEMVT